MSQQRKNDFDLSRSKGNVNELKHKIKLAVIAILVILVLIVSLQNTENVETKLLFATVTMPRAILLLAMIAIGFVIGWLTGARYSMKKIAK